ncbi:amidase signature enzyme [Xylona heveae TC161]|uniref:Amidase signature enzyme n=1 Tax=Xylona heveae (strain CBS 132557 / TC161) TaxID=1328760 RepID=A0A165GE09_XYLHT|nr:amidase signature enzyme [Xylona heveae TC161]KZF22078.1 amidase signature enzyme [Xylona heveae TC161]
MTSTHQDSSTSASAPAFYNYPQPRAGPSIPYDNPKKSNPVVRGYPLSIGAIAISSLNFVQNYLWSNAGFDALRSIAILDSIQPRYDPTVVPISQPSELHTSATNGFSSVQREGSKKIYHSVADFHEAYTSGKLTPTAVAEALLPLIRRDGPKPGEHSTAFLETNTELVLKAAKESTERYKAGKPLGQLDGIPVAVKDEVDLFGYSKCLGTARDFTNKDGATSWCVKKWEEQGVVILGKLNMHELGLDTTNNNPIKGTPLNPHNNHYYTGGSSGGTAYAISAGLVPFALGADGGGSIRIPANYCGIYGLKPSHGRVSIRPTPSLAASTGVAGPLANCMADLEIAYRVLATPDSGNPSSALFPAAGHSSQAQQNQSKKTIGICKDWYSRAEPEVREACSAAVQFLEKELGYQVIDISIPYLPEGQLAHAMTILSEIASVIKGNVKGLTAPNKVLISVGSKTPAIDFLQAQKLRCLIMEHLAHLFQTHPGLLIVTPTTPNPGWHISGGPGDLKHGVSDGNMSMRNMEYVWLANFTGLPSLSAPVGYARPLKGEGQIPIGIMVTAEWGAEDALIECGKHLENYLHSKLPGGQNQPATWVDVFERASQATS